MTLPDPYADLAAEPAPRLLIEGLKTLGIVEVPGTQSNAQILGWWRLLAEAGLTRPYGDGFYSEDSIPWCGLWMALTAHCAGKPVPRLFLSAKAWADWGRSVDGSPKLGDVLVFTRKGGGHVGLYVGEDRDAYHVLGGNQSDAVTIARLGKSRMFAARNSFAIAQPSNCRRIWRAKEGIPLSTNEA